MIKIPLVHSAKSAHTPASARYAYEVSWIPVTGAGIKGQRMSDIVIAKDDRQAVRETKYTAKHYDAAKATQIRIKNTGTKVDKYGAPIRERRQKIRAV
jgi:hypothetical protein